MAVLAAGGPGGAHRQDRQRSGSALPWRVSSSSTSPGSLAGQRGAGAPGGQPPGPGRHGMRSAPDDLPQDLGGAHRLHHQHHRAGGNERRDDASPRPPRPEGFQPGRIETVGWLSVIYYGAVATVIAYILWGDGALRIPATGRGSPPPRCRSARSCFRPWSWASRSGRRTWRVRGACGGIISQSNPGRKSMMEKGEAWNAGTPARPSGSW